MKTRKLTTTDAFVLLDLEDGPVHVGTVRSAPKILQSGAEMLARSITYTFAAFGIEAGGASAGVNAAPEDRAAAVAAFAAEVAGWDGIRLDAGKGVDAADLAELRAADPRPADLHDVVDGLTGAERLTVAGAVAAAVAAAGTLSGKRVAIEGFGPAGLAIARAVEAAGGGIVAVSTGAGTLLTPDGIGADTLADAWASHGEGFVKQTDGTQKPAWALWGAAADVIFTGSKAGALTHEGAAHLTAGTIVPTGPVPVTTKAVAAFLRSGVTYVPDFLALAAPYLVGAGAAAANDAADKVADAVSRHLGHGDGLLLGACSAAEDFLRTWRPNPPFGRPLA